MQLLASDILIHAFTPDDGSSSAAIKIVHRTGRQEVINHDTDSQRENLRRAVLAMVAKLNPNPELIPPPALLLFEQVRVHLPQSVHEGQIARISWDFARGEWTYFVECASPLVSTWYVQADLSVLEPGED